MVYSFLLNLCEKSQWKQHRNYQIYYNNNNKENKIVLKSQVPVNQLHVVQLTWQIGFFLRLEKKNLFDFELIWWFLQLLVPLSDSRVRCFFCLILLYLFNFFSFSLSSIWVMFAISLIFLLFCIFICLGYDFFSLVMFVFLDFFKYIFWIIIRICNHAWCCNSGVSLRNKIKIIFFVKLAFSQNKNSLLKLCSCFVLNIP